ncbi:MAG TPA: UbiA-like polyprenyltransferase [Tepidisphaeraceae bacterium]|jgi:4-hydroxybenzoate polyprenyltransferase
MTANLANPTATTFPQRMALFARDIKFSHTVFALPWAIFATFLAAKGQPGAIQLVLIIACMLTARTVAMANNRLFDSGLDKLNPRTAGRAIPSGALPPSFVITMAITCSIGFILCTGAFYWIFGNVWPVALSVPVLLYVSAYPLLKRFTRLCHYYLGAALALAPVCAWIAIAGKLAWPPIIMAAAVLTWTAGFDIIYACQDYESDCAAGLFSIPSRFGISAALWIARLTHAISAVMIVLLGIVAHPPLGTLYFTGAAIAIALLVVEHALVRPTDLSKVGLAFFTVNGVISLLLGTLGVIDVFV